MDISVVQGDITAFACDVLIVNLFSGVTHPGGGTGAVDQALGGWISESIHREEFSGKLNEVLELPIYDKLPVRRVLVIGLGNPQEFGDEQVRQVAATAIKRARALKAKSVATLLHGAGIACMPAATSAQAIAEGTLLGAYEFDKYRSGPNQKSVIEQFTIVEHDGAKLPDITEGVRVGRIIAEAVNMTRDLTNEPPDLITPDFLAFSAQAVAKEYGFMCEIWDEGRIAQERMNCLLMVGRGSSNAPRFIRMDYAPDGTPQKRVCLVGKGMCYDSGGLSLKPAEFMKHMKTDMAGSAALIGVMRVIAQLKPDVAVTALIPAAENMISGAAYKVDDILRARNGKTIEIDNTDAEGRLILADALSYAAEQQFDEVIDVATLTGGAIIAFGHIWTAVMGNDQELAERLIAAGNGVGEQMWMLPFDPEVREMLDSDIADIRNSAGREASSIQGGMFLQEFAGSQPWAHLDIAGTSFLDKKDRHYVSKHATGIPVRTLVAYIMS